MFTSLLFRQFFLLVRWLSIATLLCGLSLPGVSTLFSASLPAKRVLAMHKSSEKFYGKRVALNVQFLLVIG